MAKKRDMNYNSVLMAIFSLQPIILYHMPILV